MLIDDKTKYYEVDGLSKLSVFAALSQIII